MDKIRSRTLWIVLIMLGSTVYLAHQHDWPATYVLVAWVILISGWFGGKAWRSFLDVAKAWVQK